jgi:hypothetical protein
MKTKNVDSETMADILGTTYIQSLMREAHL